MLCLVLFLVGFLLLALELYSPQNGNFGLTGLCFIMIGGFYKAMEKGPIAVFIIFLIIIILILILHKIMKKGKCTRQTNYVLEQCSDASKDNCLQNEELIGREGIALEDMSPEGKVDFGGIIRKASSGGKLVLKGSYVKAVQLRGKDIIVIEIKKAKKNLIKMLIKKLNKIAPKNNNS